MLLLLLLVMMLLLWWSHPRRRRPTPTQVVLPCAMLLALLLYHHVGALYPPAFVNTVDCVFLLLRVVVGVCVSARACMLLAGGRCL